MRVVATLTTNNFASLARLLPQTVGDISEETAREIEADAKAAMGEPKHGRTYGRGTVRRYFKPGSRTAEAYAAAGLRGGFTARGRRYFIVGYHIHRASAPGEAPAIDTSNLVNSIQVERVNTQSNVYTNEEYAEYLEYGTRKMDPRPFLTPAADRARPVFVRRLNELEARLR